MTTFFDTSALFAAINDHEPHHKWSKKQLETAQRPIVIVDIVYAEFSVGMDTVHEVNTAVQDLFLERHPGGGDAALFNAAKAYHKYKKKNKGTKTSLLPDFLIGAAAEAEGATLVTANPREYLHYFPGMKILLPPTLAKPPAAGATKNPRPKSSRP
jgi:predicted nucleic acid-binding protein